MNPNDPAPTEPLARELPPSTAPHVADTVDVTQGYVEQPTTQPVAVAPPEGAPEIPGYRIMGEIARGGMGQVWSAIDFELDREVAVKTLLSGVGAERFVTEAKITARLPHPGIPPVYRLGVLPDGTHYLAMKLIRGRTLAALLADRATPQEGLSRLVQVFEQICQAVGFAHARGIIHRDLKPLNVMVGEFGEVQVMDWGLARQSRNPDCGLRNDERPDTASHAELTQLGAIMGTPSYMAPEQARGEVVDQRADVFALGSILAAILTGQPAFVGKTGHETIAKAAAADLDNVLSRLDNCTAEGELINLALQCLSAHAANRPADANAVAATVTAYRHGVETRLRQAETERAEALVREAEQLKRRNVVIRAAALVAILLITGILGTSFGLLRANEARIAEARQAKEADLKRQAAEKAREAEQAAKLDAQNKQAEAESARTDEAQARQRAEGVTAYLVKTFRSPDPRRDGRTITMAEVLDRSLKDMHDQFSDDPLTKTTLLSAVGESYQGLGLYHESIPPFEQARDLCQAKLGGEHSATLTSMNNLAHAYQSAGKYDLALPLYEEAVTLRQAKLGRKHPDTLTSMNNLAAACKLAGRLDLALPLWKETLTLTRAALGAEHPDTLTSMNNLASAYESVGKLELALPLYQETRNLRQAKLGHDHPETLQSMSNLAGAYLSAKRLDLAVPLYEVTLKLMEVKLGAEHPDTFTVMNNLAAAYKADRKLELALPLYQETLRRRWAKLGDDHPSTLMSMNNLASAYHATGEPDLALPLLTEALKLRRAKLGTDHPDTLASMNNLANAHRSAGRLESALPLYEEMLESMRTNLGAGHPRTLAAMYNLADAYLTAEQFDRALPLIKAFVDGQRRDPARSVSAIATASLNLLKHRQFAAAEPYLREYLTQHEQKLPESFMAFNARSLLGAALAGQKKFDEAEPLLLEGYEGMKAREDKIPPVSKIRLTEAVRRLVDLYTAWEKPEEAARWKAVLEAATSPKE